VKSKWLEALTRFKWVEALNLKPESRVEKHSSFNTIQNINAFILFEKFILPLALNLIILLHAF
jgi:hypothetical protein